MDPQFNAHYPFSNTAKKHIGTMRVDVDYSLIEMGKRRLSEALLKGKISTISASFGRGDEVASYAVARMIVSLIPGRQVIERYAVAEAKRASSYLKSDTDENISTIAKDFGLGEGPETGVVQYLRYSPQAPEYKLINRRLENGRVFLSKNEFIRVIEEAIRIRISSSLPIKVRNPPPILKEAAEELQASLPKAPKIEPRVPGETPPCIIYLTESLNRGENLSHAARWTLTIYMLRTGMSEREIIKLFSNAPDYDERITRYQVEYIRRKGYNMPSCKLMDSHGICVNRCGIHNPLSYKGKRFNKYAEKK
ncbi:MAG: hypothetical protein ABIG39_05910 [Candidatus Micrarchaeota archaeon]